VSAEEPLPQPKDSGNARRSVFRGTLLAVAARWTDRAIGVVSVLVLARLLTPEDFGLVALAMVVVGFVDLFLDIGVNIQLIRNQNATRDDYDTAWTIRLLEGIIATFVILALAGAAGGYFNDSRVTIILYSLALLPTTNALANIGIIDFQKTLDFGREFRYRLTRRLIGFAVTIAATVLLRSYWALVIGAMTTSVVGTVLSYTFHEYRPRWSLKRAREMIGFSAWLMLRSIGVFISVQIDKAVLGRISSAEVVGAYKLADDLSHLPTADLLAPVGRALFPAFAQDYGHPDRIRHTYVLALAISTLLVIPTGLGLALVADVAVPSLLGNQWLPAIPLLQILALTSAINAFGHTSVFLSLAGGTFRTLTLIVYGQVGVFLVLTLTGPLGADAAGVAVARLIATVLATVCLTALVVSQHARIRLLDYADATWRPILGAIGMAAVVLWLPLSAQPPLMQLFSKAVLGALSYGTFVLLLWICAGRPPGAERYLLEKFRALRRPPTR
jgi:O-antigen/teichoic acid export membrane protein